jgi:hypothetical protein
MPAAPITASKGDRLLTMWEQNAAKLIALPPVEQTAYAALFIARFGHLVPSAQAA